MVFRTPEGRLTSLRAREVDLDASHARTEASHAPAAGIDTGPPTRREGPVLVITDADVRRAPVGADSRIESTDEDPEAADEDGGTVEIVSWQDRVDVEANALEITGALVNRGEAVATDTRLEVRLLDADGALLESRRAAIGRPALGPGESASFHASFPGNPGFAAIGFDVRSRGFRVAPRPATPDER